MNLLRGKLVGSLIAAFVLLAIPSAASAASSSGPVKPCNGSVELCSRTLDQVVLPGSHNSMSASELDWFRPNQTFSIPNQLERGARAMLIDTYYGQRRTLANGTTTVDKLGRAAGSAIGAEMFLCHETCLWGYSNLIDVFSEIRAFLAANPREVMVFVNQDNVTPADYARAVEESGLIDFVYRGSTDEYPTLGVMVDSNQRVVMFAEQQSDGVDWYHKTDSGAVQETPYDFSSWANLFVPEMLNRSCEPGRGGGTGPLFLMNNWVSRPQGTDIPPPIISDAVIVNSKSALVARARACEARRSKLPNILAVDFFGSGDVVGAARELNDVEPAPFLELGSARPARVRAGGAATFRVNVSNIGDGTSESLRVCATAPRRLIRGSACQNLGALGSGSSRTAVLRVRTLPRASGRGAVNIRMATSSGPLSSRTNLTVVAPRRPRTR